MHNIYKYIYKIYEIYNAYKKEEVNKGRKRETNKIHIPIHTSVLRIESRLEMIE